MNEDYREEIQHALQTLSSVAKESGLIIAEVIVADESRDTGPQFVAELQEFMYQHGIVACAIAIDPKQLKRQNLRENHWARKFKKSWAAIKRFLAEDT